ncbi:MULTISPECIES: META domain-containing protein [Flavobacteriaceae]|uniref:META domain-containing protein n=1 Tax=Flavobacteriaceae TaxID=49546 RepID=UPI001492F218|nr:MULTISPECIES: META domain-containing protein [Allomuricauda]MDC6367762.1 META domain-containing protein [Muricauda sp. AC10]
MKKIKSFVLCVVCFLAFASCEKNEDSNVGTDPYAKLTAVVKTLDDSQWTFTNYTLRPFEKAYENKITLEFWDIEDQKASYSGKSVVNEYAGSFTFNEQEGLIIENKDMITTEMASINQRDNIVESEYYLNFLKGKSFEIKNEELLLYLGNPANENVEVMRFTKQE